MATTTISWKPFNALGMTQVETADAIHLACGQIRSACGWDIIFDQDLRHKRGDFYIEGRDSNDAAGWAGHRRVRISTQRKLTGRNHQTMVMFIIHEILHLNKKPSLDWGHVIDIDDAHKDDEFRNYLMHPWGSSTGWFHPVEVKLLQKSFGLPRIKLTRSKVYPIKAAGDIARRWLEVRNDRYLKWKNNPTDARRANFEAAKQNHLKHRENYMQQVKLWKSFELID